MASKKDTLPRDEIFNSTVIKLFCSCIPAGLDGNVVFGARSVYDGLLSLYHGSDAEARAVADTYGLLQMKPPSNNCCISVCVLLHHDDKTGHVKESFLKSIRNSGILVAVFGFSSKVKLTDMDADIEQFNKLVEKMTENKIENAITRDNLKLPGRVDLLMHTKFTGHWKRPFHYMNTELDGKFKIKDDMTITLPLMCIDDDILDIPMASIESMDADVYMLPYKENASMLVYLPKSVVEFDVLWMAILIFNSNDTRFEETLLEPLTLQQYSGITMPKYKYSTDLDISEGLKKLAPFNQLNMSDVFEVPRSDESSYTFHIRSHINNDEEGTITESTFETYEYDSCVPELPHILINKPFAYFIIQDSNDIVDLGIFMGQEAKSQ